MSKKLLSEAQIRRFQSLANIGSMNEMYSYNEEEAAEEMAEEMDMEDEAPEAELAPIEDAPEADEEEESDVEIEQSDIDAIADALSLLQDKLSPLTGAASEEEAEMDDMEMADEMPGT